MEGVVEHDHGGPAGRDARDLDGVLDRLGAATQEQRLLVGAPARRELGEPPAHLHVRLVHPDHEALVHVAVDLRMDRVDDGGQVVAEVGAAEPAGEVDVLAPLGVPDPRALGPLDDERRGRDPARHVALAGLLDALGCAAFLQRHGNRDCICAIRPAKARLTQRRPRWGRPADTIPPPGALAEWLGSGLQSRLQQFESARRLSAEVVEACRRPAPGVDAGSALISRRSGASASARAARDRIVEGAGATGSQVAAEAVEVAPVPASCHRPSTADQGCTVPAVVVAFCSILEGFGPAHRGRSD